MRKKTVTLDNISFVISPLTIEQVEQFTAPPNGDGPQEIRARAFDVVSWALNNAGADPPWTHERIRKELDLGTFEWLQDEILSLSRLKLVENLRAQAGLPGEADPAVAGSKPI